MIVYVVTEGCYSNYHIAAIFSSRWKADAYLAEVISVSNDDASIEEWELDEKSGYYACDSWIADITISTGEIKSSRWRKELAAPHVRAKEITCIEAGTILSAISFVSEEHARKLAVEARQAWIREHGTPLRTAEEIKRFGR